MMEKLNDMSNNVLLTKDIQDIEFEISEKDLKEKISILNSIGCSKIQIKNIIDSNMNFLSRTNNSIMKLITYLKKLGFNMISMLLDANPYILNLEEYEIKKYINERISNGEFKEDIIDDLDSNPYLFLDI